MTAGNRRDRLLMNICIVNCFEGYEARVDLLRSVLMGAGHRVTVLMSDFLHVAKTRRTEPKEGFVFLPAGEYRSNLSVARMKAHRFLSRNIHAWLREHQQEVDAVWTVFPPNSFAADGAALKREIPRIRLILDVNDLWPETMPVGMIKNLFPFTLWRRLRDGSLKDADLVVTECDLFREKLSGVLAGKRAETIYLAREDTGLRTEPQLPEKGISLCYLGSINNVIDIEGIAQLIGRLAASRPVTLHVIGNGENRELFLHRCAEAGAEIQDHGTVYDAAEKRAVFDRCHYGLNMMKKEVCVGLTNKSADYLEAGLPLLNNLQGDTLELVRRHGIGINITEEPVPEVYDPEMRKRARAFYERNLSRQVFERKVLHTLEIIGK